MSTRSARCIGFVNRFLNSTHTNIFSIFSSPTKYCSTYFLRFSGLLFSVLLTGCAAIDVTTSNARFDGLYMMDAFTGAGKVRTVYQFAPNNKVYITKRKNFSDEEAIRWSKDASRIAKTYSFANGRVALYSHISQNRTELAEEPLLLSDYTLGHRKFYAFTDKGLTFDHKRYGKKPEKTISIYSHDGTPVLTDTLSKVYAVGQQAFILQYPERYTLYDAQNKANLLDATFMTALSDTEDLIMVYKESGFGVVDASGREIVPFIYDDMMDLGQGIIGTMKGEIWSIRDVESNEFVTLAKGSMPLTKRLTGQVVPIFENNEARFFSLSHKQFLKFTTPRFYSVASSTLFFIGVRKNKWVLLNNEGKYALPFYLKSVAHNNEHLVVQDIKGTAKVFTEKGKEVSIFVDGKLSLIRSEGYANKQDKSPLLQLIRGKNRGITDIKGKVLVEPAYEAIHYLGNDHFLLDSGAGTKGNSGAGTKGSQIYIKGKGIINVPVQSMAYVNGDVVVVRDQDRKYGLWSTLTSDWVIKPKDYDLIEGGVDSHYLTYRMKVGISNNYGVMRDDGVVIHPASLDGTVSIEGDYLYNTKNQQITLYRLPRMQEIMRVTGDKLTIEHDEYFVVTHKE